MLTGKTLLQCLRCLNEPMKLNDLIIAMMLQEGIGANEEDVTAHKVKALIKSAKHLGFIEEYNDHFYVATHAEDVAGQLDGFNDLFNLNMDEDAESDFSSDPDSD